MTHRTVVSIGTGADALNWDMSSATGVVDQGLASVSIGQVIPEGNWWPGHPDPDVATIVILTNDLPSLLPKLERGAIVQAKIFTPALAPDPVIAFYGKLAQAKVTHDGEIAVVTVTAADRRADLQDIPFLAEHAAGGQGAAGVIGDTSTATLPYFVWSEAGSVATMFGAEPDYYGGSVDYHGPTYAAIGSNDVLTNIANQVERLSFSAAVGYAATNNTVPGEIDRYSPGRVVLVTDITDGTYKWAIIRKRPNPADAQLLDAAVVDQDPAWVLTKRRTNTRVHLQHQTIGGTFNWRDNPIVGPSLDDVVQQGYAVDATNTDPEQILSTRQDLWVTRIIGGTDADNNGIYGPDGRVHYPLEVLANLYLNDLDQAPPWQADKYVVDVDDATVLPELGDGVIIRRARTAWTPAGVGSPGSPTVSLPGVVTSRTATIAGDKLELELTTRPAPWITLADHATLTIDDAAGTAVTNFDDPLLFPVAPTVYVSNVTPGCTVTVTGSSTAGFTFDYTGPGSVGFLLEFDWEAYA